MKGKSKMDNPKKLAIYDTQDKQNKFTTQGSPSWNVYNIFWLSCVSPLIFTIPVILNLLVFQYVSCAGGLKNTYKTLLLQDIMICFKVMHILALCVLMKVFLWSRKTSTLYHKPLLVMNLVTGRRFSTWITIFFFSLIKSWLSVFFLFKGYDQPILCIHVL